MIRCKKLPEIVAEWQQIAWCPDCGHYDDGTCSHATSECPHEGGLTPIGEMAHHNQTMFATLRQAIARKIVERTGRRIQLLKVEVRDDRVIVRGVVACYHLKQLALLGVLDVLGAGNTVRIELDVEVENRTHRQFVAEEEYDEQLVGTISETPLRGAVSGADAGHQP